MRRRLVFLLQYLATRGELVILSAAGAKDLVTRTRHGGPAASAPSEFRPLAPTPWRGRAGTRRRGQVPAPARAPTPQTRSPRTRRAPPAANRDRSRRAERRARRRGTAACDSRDRHAVARAANTSPGH